MLSRVIALALAVVVPACSKDKTPPTPAPAPAPAPAPGSQVAAPKDACKLDPLPLRRPAPKRLVAIGDLHGDLGGARAALRTAGAIDASDRWIGGDLVVVQTGDLLDRGGDEQAIMDLLFRLEGEAAAAGGALIVLLGNHELMNGALDFRYVPPEGFKDFDDVPGIDLARWRDVPAHARGRVASLAPGGPYAKRLARHDVVAIVGDTVFSHAGPVGEWADHLDEVNRSARCWLDGQSGDFQQRPAVLTAQDSPVWTRAYGMPDADCAGAKAALATLGVKRIVVGHTVQQSGINSACDGTVWRIDVGLAKGYGGPIQVLEITATGAKVLAGER